MTKKIKRSVLCWLLCLAVGQAATAQDLITTVGGTLTTNYEWYYYKNGGSTTQYSGCLVDNNTATKFFIYYNYDYTALPILAQYKFNASSIAAQYTLTSGNDAPERDPKTWTLEASNDGATWTTIDTRTNQSFANRTQTNVYDIAAPASYLYYRLNISALVNANNDFQLSEWRLLGPAAPNGAPSGLAGFASSGVEINLGWTDNSTNESSFVIERSTDGVNYTPIGSVPGNTTSYTDNAGLLVNTLYYYRVKGMNNSGSSAYTMINLKTLNQSGAVTDVTDDGGTLSVSVENTGGATANEGSLKLTDNNYGTKYLAFGSVPAAGFWTQYNAKYSWIVTGYTLTSANDAQGRDPKTWQFQGSSDGSTWATLDTRSNVSLPKRSTQYRFTFSNTAAYNYYRLLVTANNGATDGVMTQIAEWEIWGMNAAAPAVPTNLAITNTSFNSVALSWKDNATSESGYQIERSEDGIIFSAAGTAAANATSYTDQNLYGGTLYYYRVRALSSAAGMSVPSNVVSTTTLWDPALPLSPRNLTAVASSASDIALTWDDKSANEDGFKIERSADGVAFTPIATVAANTVTYTNTGLVKATKYYYRVIAYNTAGTSYYTNIASAITQGVNTAPTFKAVGDTTVCSKAFVYKILFTGINAGSAAESYQKIVMGAVSSNAGLFASLSFSAVSHDSAWLSFQTQGDAKDSAVITVTATDDGGTYNGGSNSMVRTFKIVFNPLTIAIASLEGTDIALYQSAHLTAYGDRVTSYLWSDTTGIISTARNTNKLVVKPTYHTLYTVTGSNAEGCAVSAAITIGIGGSVLPNPVNVLTPNGDGKNDKWIVWNINRYPDNTVQVFDRAGRQVFYKKNYLNDWDGTYNGRPLAEGAYLYVITFGSGISPLKGVLTIIHDHK